MKIKSEIVALVHFTLQKKKSIMYGYFGRGNKQRIAKHFNTSIYLLTKYCKLLIEKGFAKKEGDNLIIFSVQNIIHSLEDDNPDRKLLRILRGVFKVHVSGTMHGLSFNEVKLKIITYLTFNHYKTQEWNIRRFNKPLSRSGNSQSKKIAVSPVFSSLRMFSKHFEIPISTLARLYIKAADLRYLDRVPVWLNGNIPGMWSAQRTLFNKTEWISLCGYKYIVRLY